MNRILFTLIFFILAISVLTAVPRSKVVVEIATGTWCPYCPFAAAAADDLVINGYDVAIIENHGGDTFETTASNARNSYYNVSGYPTACFDGGNAYVGGSAANYNAYVQRVNSRMAVNSHFTIAASGTSNSSTYNITVNLNKVEPDTNTNLYLHAIITESDIHYNWQGQTHLNFVSRLMIPNQSGTSLNFGTGTVLSIPLSFNMNAAWVPVNCELVIFLQNNSTKEILQGTKYSFAELFGQNPASLAEITFPDTYVTQSEVAPLVLTNPGSTTMTGSITSDNPAFTIAPAGRINYSIAPYGTQTFDVTFNAASASNVTGNIIITTNLALYPTITIPVSGTGEYAPPKAPENISIVMSNNNAVISWSAVTETVIDAPVEPDWYLFYCNSSGNINGTFQYLWRTRLLQNTHNNAAFNSIPKFYRIIAQKNYARNGNDPTNALQPGMTEDEVNAILSGSAKRN
jgi:hypothetical protein